MSADDHPICEHEHKHEHEGGGAGVWLEVATLLVLATFLAFSFLAGRVRFFVASYYVWLPPVTALVLLAMGAARLRAHFRGRIACACEEDHAAQLPLLACVAVIITAVAFALVVNPKQFSPEGFRKRRVSGPPRNARLERAVDWVLGLKAAEKKPAAQTVSLPENPTVLDLLDAAAECEPEAIEGRFVTVMGQCDLLHGPESRRFDLYRLVVTCCIADATGVAIEVVRPATVKLESGGWVRVGGILKFDSASDDFLPVVHATIISKIADPSEPYL